MGEEWELGLGGQLVRELERTHLVSSLTNTTVKNLQGRNRYRFGRSFRSIRSCRDLRGHKRSSRHKQNRMVGWGLAQRMMIWPDCILLELYKHLVGLA